MDKVLIITGGSKGIGRAVIDQYIGKGFTVFSISRTRANDLEKAEQIKFDLSNVNGIEKMFTELFQKLNRYTMEKISLINNAATIGSIKRIENNSSDDLFKTIQLNVTTPLILSSFFIRLTEGWKAKKSIINISSGAALRPISGWTSYCASKAALDMITKGIATEQGGVENGVKAISIYPGVVDTGMQEKIRNSNKNDFTDVQRFIDMKTNSTLADPKTVAEKIYAVDNDTTVENGTCVDVRMMK